MDALEILARAEDEALVAARPQAVAAEDPLPGGFKLSSVSANARS